MIAFQALGDGPGFQIHVMDADGENLRVLGRGGLPRWSPDGNQIAFVEGFQTHVMNADGSERRKLTSVEGGAMYPVWSPDGSKIAFTFLLHGGDFEESEIYVMNIDGSDLTNLTSNESFDGHAYWW
jgi:Tol biopolymer transport system component